MRTLPYLKMGDTVEIIAPAARSTDERLADLKKLLISWQLQCIVDDQIFGDDLLCANSDAKRFQLLKNAVERPETKAIICVRGGYGSARLMPELDNIITPRFPKLFVGMSDITALHLYFQQKWQWPTLHAALGRDLFSDESTEAVKRILLGEVNQITMPGIALNELARADAIINAEIVGGNLSIIQTSIGTSWQINTANKILFLEETNERGYRVDRQLEHLRQVGIFKNVKAIIFGDFIKGNEPDGTSLIKPVLERFAQSCGIPVVQIAGIGHDRTNFPLPLGTPAKLILSSSPQLICQR